MSKVKHFIRQSWLLIVAAFLFGLLIAVTDAALRPRIIQNEKDKLNNLMTTLIVDAENFDLAIEQTEITGNKGRLLKTDIYKAFDVNGDSVGFAFVAVGAGFADKIKLVIAVDGRCEKFLGFKVLSSNETPGFGSRITEDDFCNQFKGAPAGKLELVKTGKKKDTQILTITGATVSSEAVVRIFNTYIDQIRDQLQAKGFISDGR